MTIGTGLIAFIVFLAVVFLWILVLKRNVTEGLGAAFLIISLFMGPANYPSTILSALNTAAMDTPFLATMLFMLMAAIMNRAGVIERLVELLNSLIGKVRGGAAYVSTCASFMFGLVSGNGDANSATVGAITVPWMKESGCLGEDKPISRHSSNGITAFVCSVVAKVDHDISIPFKVICPVLTWIRLIGMRI